MPLSRADFDFVRDLVCSRSAIALPAEKLYLAEARLGPLALAEGFGSIAELLGQVRALPGGGLPQKVVEALATHETSFFRDLHPFEALRRDILPELIQRRSAERRLEIWSAACSSGQEPYSIAMLLREHFAGLPGWTVSILATDISSEILRKAGEGRYNQAEINRGLPARLLVKYFRKQGTSWQLTDDIRRMVEFRALNLIEPWPRLRAPDILLLRNALIYFETETKKMILSRIHRVLRPDGYLFLGGAESTLGLADAFERTDHERAGCYRLR
ncbi:MCP methyltransferase, CheR-type [Singulisphaera sp. GP187]|uniref:CheR family methyltransferase n=1 Tax=Singulisphaera sp. GP187 TaxID=1882752 RepID=UPI0009267EA5|nr:protein-glutamate O-methyltransferase CheR [Singulisphaera sp. GP187]SIO56739.1 MCP methyltransferase, CheR-type [Singulisphaera sp. GP187]